MLQPVEVREGRTMDRRRALEILRVLARGEDPTTGEILPEESPYQHAEVVRALFAAIEALEGQRSRATGRRNLPANAGKSWTAEEEARLCEAFDADPSIPALAQAHQRTTGAIKARLIKLGKIEDTTDTSVAQRDRPPRMDRGNLDSKELENEEAGVAERLCTECGKPIESIRLKAVPGVVRCADCQDHLERRDPDRALS
jgi:RNA polymerase-binding transcription factor DksA